mgnify:CR=1 FL=1|tara:strand:+ start:1409 stop:2632 length:1224 start_codon:yes stop_codon:yes gene_type:complete
MQQSYHKLSKLIHWATALIIFVLLLVGFNMTAMEYSDDKIQLYNLHKSFGILVLILLVLRIAMLVIKGKPKSLPTHKSWEKGLSHLVHVLLYLALLAIPLSGWIMSSAGDFPVKFFGLTLPPITTKNENLFELSEEAHEIMALCLIAIVGLHILGALKHHFIDRDETLKRMTSPSFGMKAGIFLTLAVALLFAPSVYKAGEEVLHELSEEEHREHEEDAHEERAELKTVSDKIKTASVTAWDVDQEASIINISVVQSGAPFSGHFSDIAGDIFFDPEFLDQSSVYIKIPVATLETGSSDRDAQAQSEDWFYAKEFPYIIFESKSFEKAEESNKFISNGELSIRGVTMPITLPFELLIEESNSQQDAVMKAEIVLNRLDFGVGQGEWKKTDTIENEVSLTINLQAHAQ